MAIGEAGLRYGGKVLTLLIYYAACRNALNKIKLFFSRNRAITLY